MNDCGANNIHQIPANTKMPSVTVPELNNNSENTLDSIYRPRSESRASTISSASSSNETNEEIELADIGSQQEETKTDDSNEVIN